MIFSFSRLSLYESCPYRFYKKYVLGHKEPTTLPLALGKAVHKAIENKINGIKHSEAILNGLIEADFHKEVTAEDVSFLTERANVQPGMGKTEIYFKLPLESSENAPLLQGYIDVVANKGKAIMDWKTNRVPFHVLDTHQAGLYAWAMGELYNTSYVVGTLYFLRFKKRSSHCFTPFDMDNARLWALKGLQRRLMNAWNCMGCCQKRQRKNLPSISGKPLQALPVRKGMFARICCNLMLDEQFLSKIACILFINLLHFMCIINQ
ncbi:hypothetical protein ACA29_03050 [Lederbergia galactosidilytica]|uniref:PD-(D/E)XK endonuclease-like domain-containing protein n=1 Tax=Lederbergia galactosidilytica TaxID=217031 RepID=A0A0Q9Y7P6_9BACI|nr:hypothetical protein ACA29_03050 [Lederbergia galactosidilytica]